MAPVALPHLYNKDTALFFNGQMIFIKRMKNLIKKILKESEEEFGWAQTTLINPWEVGYTGVRFDTEPTRKNLATLIEMALATNPSNTNEWSLDIREEDIDDIIYHYRNGESYLVLNKYNNLAYGPNKNYSDWRGVKYIEYSKLIDKPSINESEDDWDWVRDIDAGIVIQPNTLYYFEPKLKADEVKNFADSIVDDANNHTYAIKEWLSTIPQYNHDVYKDGGIKYFMTRPDKYPIRLQSWCTQTDVDYAKSLYPGVRVVDARKEFNL